MTFSDWTTIEEHYFDFVAYYSELTDLPEWSDWEKRIDKALSKMDYEDAKSCEFENLLESTVTETEIELAFKCKKEREALERINMDF